ncbi:toxin-antitoxin system, toxin component, PIN domain protein [Leptospira santarosai str. 2000030832]|nr:toxin-antitoxin system, toxin component, PIN domain protein [Leptospira santarosai str. 2000030832]
MQRKKSDPDNEDSDFLDSYLLRNEPKKLLSVTTGNIRNKDLILLFDQLMNTILIEFENNH